MTADAKQSTEITRVKLPPDRLKAKADILETNIYSAIKQSQDGIHASFEIDREGIITQVLIKALQQLLESFDINAAALMEKLAAVLPHKIDETKGQIRLKQTFRSKNLPGIERNASISVSNKKIILTINGTQPVKGVDGDVREYFFEHENYPGKILPNGKMDFREINRFPSIKAGEDLMIINYAKPGKPGITFSGNEIPVPAVADMNIELLEGVERIEKRNQEGNPDGYLIRSKKTGVVVLTKNNEKFSAIDVTDNIELDEIDYSIGNIGSEFICPVSLNIGTINNGFKVRVDGQINVNILNGGEVHTKSDATFDQIQPGSTVFASRNITTRIVINSKLTSPNGSISIGSELRDSTLSAGRVEFTGSRGLVLNTNVEAEDLDYNNVSICGDNYICLGKPLFESRSHLLKDKNNLTERVEKVKKLQIEIKNHLVEELKKLSSQKQQQVDVQDYKLLIQSLQTFLFSDALILLDRLKKQNTTSRVINSIRKNFLILQQLQDGISGANQRLAEIEKELPEIENRLNSMKFNIKGKMKPASSIKIFCTREGIESEPAHKIDPNQQQGDKLVSVSGRYSLETGLVLNQL
ncbi:MAG: flagellar assembly protein A [Pseudomonadota bacterium]